MSYTVQGDFVRVQKGRHADGAQTNTDAPYAVSLVANKDRTKDGEIIRGHRIIIRLMGVVLDELGWTPGQYVDVLEGTGKSAGKLLLVKAERPSTGYRLSRIHNNRRDISQRAYNGSLTPTVSIAIGHAAIVHHTMPQERMLQTAIQGRPFNSELLLDMPPWFKPIMPEQQQSAQPAMREAAQRNASTTMAHAMTKAQHRATMYNKGRR